MSVCRKFVSAILSVALIASFSVTAFASVGYTNADKMPSTTTAATTSAAVTAANAKDQAAAQVAAQIKANPEATKLSVKIDNLTQAVSKDVISAMFTDAGEKDLSAKFRTVADKAVVTQVSLTKENLENLPSSVNLSVTVAPAKVNAIFTQYFSNLLTTLDAPAIGSDYELCYRLNDKEIENVVVYVYDETTNQYAKVDPANVFIDKNGYVHILAGGGKYILSAGELTKK